LGSKLGLDLGMLHDVLLVVDHHDLVLLAWFDAQQGRWLGITNQLIEAQCCIASDITTQVVGVEGFAQSLLFSLSLVCPPFCLSATHKDGVCLLVFQSAMMKVLLFTQRGWTKAGLVGIRNMARTSKEIIGQVRSLSA
jgi:hypothetical protein